MFLKFSRPVFARFGIMIISHIYNITLYTYMIQTENSRRGVKWHPIWKQIIS